MGERPHFQYQDQYGETVTTTVEDCVNIAEALLIYVGIKPEVISEEFGVEVLFARASPQPEYQNYFYKK